MEGSSEIIVWPILILIGILLLAGTFSMFSVWNNRMYCEIYLKDEVSVWKKVLAEIDQLELHHELGHTATFTKNDKDGNLEYDVVLWHDEQRASVHDPHTECLACGFCKYYSTKVYDILSKRL